MATIGSIIDGGRSLVVGVIPGRAGAPERVIARPIAAQPNAAANAGGAPAKGPGQLTPAERREVTELQQRDREVRDEEERHKAAAGKFAGEPQYVYRRGPDGQLYAVEGKVPITVNVGGTAGDRIAALRRVEAAAVSVQSPSSGDFKAVAGAAAATVTAQGPDGQPDTEHRRAAERAYSARQASAADTLTRDLLNLLA